MTNNSSLLSFIEDSILGIATILLNESIKNLIYCYKDIKTKHYIKEELNSSENLNSISFVS